MRLLKIAFFTVLLIPVACICVLAIALFLSLANSPMLGQQNTSQTADADEKTLSQLAQQTDNGLLTLQDQQLSTLIRKQLTRAGLKSVLQLEFEPATVITSASLTLPIDFRRRHVNIQAVLREAAPPEHIRVVQLQIGAIKVPAATIEWSLPYLLTLCKRDNRCQLGLEAYRNIESVSINEGALQLQYSLGAETLEQLSSRGVQVDDLELEPYFAALNELAANNAGKIIELHTALQAVLTLAQQRSQQFSPIRENAAALMALAVQNANPRTRDVLFRANDVSRQLATIRVRSHSRADLAHHFINSTALFLIGGSEFSDSVGLYKEYFDALVGKHFDFSDIAGDRAGTMFARYATESELKARALQGRVIAEQNSAAYLPGKKFIDQLQSRSTKNATSKVSAIFPEIDKELATLPLLN